MLRERLVGDDLGSEIQMLFFSLALLRLLLDPLLVEALFEMRRGVGVGEGRENDIRRGSPDVHQHVGVGHSPRCSDLVSLCHRNDAVQCGALSAIILIKNLLIRNRGDAIVVKL